MYSRKEKMSQPLKELKENLKNENADQLTKLATYKGSHMSSQTNTSSVIEPKLLDLKEQVSVLEMKVAYHERLNQDLSDQVYSLHKELTQLRTLVHALKDRLQQEAKDQIEIGPANEVPPHY